MNIPNLLQRLPWAPVLILVLLAGPVQAVETNLKLLSVGAILPLTGENSSVGLEAKRGIDLAVRWMQPEFRQQGYEVQVVYEDDRMSPERGAQALQDLIRKNKIPAVIGPFTSPVMIHLGPLATGSKVVLVSGSATSPRIREMGPWVFSTSTADDRHGKAISRFAYETLRTHRAAVLYLNNPYGSGLKQRIETEFTRLGGEVVISLGHEDSQTDFRDLLSKVEAFKPQCVFVATYPVEAGLLIKQAREMGWTQPFLGGDGIYSQDLIEVAGPAARDTYATALSWRASSAHPVSRRFVRGFVKEYGVTPGLYAASYFDTATLVLRSILARAGKPPAELRDFLASTSFNGVTGEIRLRGEGAREQPVDIYKVEDYTFDYFFTLLPQ